MFKVAAIRLSQSPINVTLADLQALKASSHEWNISQLTLQALDYYGTEGSIEEFAKQISQPNGSVVAHLMEARRLLLLQIADREAVLTDTSCESYLDQLWYGAFLNEEMWSLGVGIWNAIGKRFGNSLTLRELIMIEYAELISTRGLGVTGKDKLIQLLSTRELHIGMSPDEITYWQRRMRWLPVPIPAALGVQKNVVGRRFLPRSGHVQYLMGPQYRGEQYKFTENILPVARLHDIEFVELHG